MNLYINTSGEHCELALFKEDILVVHHIHKQKMEHSTVLHDLVNKLLLQASIDFKMLTCVSLLNGPGSYTGLRIGLAAAKAYCYALNIPLILFNKLRLLCSYYSVNNRDINFIACIEPARQGEYFFTFQSTNDVICPPNVQETKFIVDILKQETDVSLISSSAEKLDDIESNVERVSLPIGYLGDQINHRLKNKEFDELYNAEPFYLKKVHANTPKKHF